MQNRERLLHIIEKVRSLAERGVDGEKENAIVILERMMKEAGMQESDLEKTETETFSLRYKTPLERQLLVQIIYMHLGPNSAYKAFSDKVKRQLKEIRFTCNPAEYLEIKADYSFYRRAMEDELQTFYQAFISKNNLFPPRELLDGFEPTVIPEEERSKIRSMMGGMDQRTRRKALKKGKGNPVTTV